MPETAALRTVTIKLPWPPSDNHYYRHVELPIGKGIPACPRCGKRKTRVCTLISEDGREYLKAVSRALFAEGIKPLRGPLAVEVDLHAPTRAIIDVANRQKGLMDALKPRPKDADQLAWLFADDDSQIDDVRFRRGSVSPGNGYCIVTVTQLPEAQAKLFAE
jgi:Holliday junction resolvase RusA-like endonuclease